MVDFKTTQGILKEIEDSVNDFKSDTTRIDEVEIRLRGCNHACKIHMINHLVDKLDYQKGNRIEAQ